MSFSDISCPSQLNVLLSPNFPGAVKVNAEKASPLSAFTNVIFLSSKDTFKTAPSIPGLSLIETLTTTFVPGFAYRLSTLIFASFVSSAITESLLIVNPETTRTIAIINAQIFFNLFIDFLSFLYVFNFYLL